MFRNVVIGADPHSDGRDALSLAVALSDEDAVIAVVRVFDPDRTVPDAPTIPDVPHGARRVTAERVAAATPAFGLHDVARRVDADLLVVGSSTKGRWAHLVFGDDVRHTVRDAPCAVAVAPREQAGRGGRFARVGVGWDSSPGARAALDAARRIAGATGGTVEALEVIIMPATMAPGTYAPIPLTSELERTREQLAALDGVEATAVLGSPQVDLARWAADLDLLVVGASSHGRVGRLLLGSVPEQLTRRMAAPLLVVLPVDAPSTQA